MKQFATSVFLAILFIDIAGSVNPNLCQGGHETPNGVRRMIEMLGNKNRGAQKCSFGQFDRSLAPVER